MDPYATGPNVGRVRHLYVLAACRRLGVGWELVAEVMEVARSRFEILRLRTNNLAAAQLYEKIGFRWRDDVDHCTHVMELGPDRR